MRGLGGMPLGGGGECGSVETMDVHTYTPAEFVRLPSAPKIVCPTSKRHGRHCPTVETKETATEAAVVHLLSAVVC